MKNTKESVKVGKEDDCELVELEIFDKNKGGSPNDIKMFLSVSKIKDDDGFCIQCCFTDSRRDKYEQVDIGISKKALKKMMKKINKLPTMKEGK